MVKPFLRQPLLVCVRALIEDCKVRASMEINEKLMKDALRATGAKTKREMVELVMKTLVQSCAQAEIRGLKVKILWKGELRVCSKPQR